MQSQNSGNFLFNTGIIHGNINQSQGVTPQPMVSPGARSHDYQDFSYDVALSYAGEQERFVSRVARLLQAEGLRVFFAPQQEEAFQAEDMITKFYQIYRYQSRYVAAFVTDAYLKKDITMHEAATAILRQKEEGRNCLIPLYFNNVKLEQLGPDINYIQADKLREVEIAEKIRAIILADFQKND